MIFLLVLEFFIFTKKNYTFDNFSKFNEKFSYLNKSFAQIKDETNVIQVIEKLDKNEEILDTKEENTLVNWENETQIKLDAQRKGPGEQGEPYKLTDPEDIERNEKLFHAEGFYVIVSDRISVERALPDKRPEA